MGFVMNIFYFSGTHWLYFKDAEVKFICRQMYLFANCAMPKLSLMEKMQFPVKILMTKSLPNVN